MSGSYSGIGEMELEENVQVWQEKIHESCFMVNGEGLVSSYKNLKRCAVVERIATTLSDPESPFASQLRHEGAAHLEDRLDQADDLLSALAQLLYQERYYEATHYYLSSLRKQAKQTPYNDLEALYDHWMDTYHGGSLKAFLANICRYQSEWSRSKYYCRAVSIVQSSGTGKSRLVDEISKEFLGISFALRLEGETGYPPGDLEVTQYLHSNDGDIEIHSNIVGLLAGVIEHLSEWYTQYTESHPQACRGEVAGAWHDLMAPAKADLEGHTRTALGWLPDTRSRFRQQFCRKALATAQSVSHELRRGSQRTPDLTKMPVVQDRLLSPTKALMDLIQRTEVATNNPAAEKSDGDPLLFLAFDEAANLFKSENDVRFAALRRVLRLLNEYPIWSLFLSTKSRIEYFDPPEKADPSGRIRSQRLSRICPFIGIQLDVEASRRLADPNLCAQELAKPLCDFATAAHMTMFGRPLWLVYAEKSYEEIRGMAAYKLLCGKSDYSPSNKHHVFAAMASRLCLDPCMNNEEATALAQEAVNSHLRVVVGTDSSSGWMTTVTPSEPIVAEAVAEILAASGEWPSSVRTLARDLLSKGLVDKGLKGELFSRLLLILARDVVLADTPLQDFKWSQHFPLSEFLNALYAPRIFQNLDSPRLERRRRNRTKSFSDSFAGAVMNFSHFTSTDQCLRRDTIRDLLHNLMRQQAALQLCHGQIHWDLLIPIYFGTPAAPFDPSALSAVVVQVKNRHRATPLKIDGREYDDLFGISDAFANPVLCIHLDLESTPTGGHRVKLKGGESPVFGIYSRGAGSTTFGCLKQIPGMEDACQEFFRIVSPRDAPEQDICSHNLVFRYHGWHERFPQMCEAGREREAEAGSEEEMGYSESEEDREDQEMGDADADAEKGE